MDTQIGQTCIKNVWNIKTWNMLTVSHDRIALLLLLSVSHYWLSLFVMSMYQSCLLARLIVPRSEPPFKDANELISLTQRKEYRLVTDSLDYGMFMEIQHSESYVMVQMRQEIEQNPILKESICWIWSKINIVFSYNNASHKLSGESDIVDVPLK